MKKLTGSEADTPSFLRGQEPLWSGNSYQRIYVFKCAWFLTQENNF